MPTGSLSPLSLNSPSRPPSSSPPSSREKKRPAFFLEGEGGGGLAWHPKHGGGGKGPATMETSRQWEGLERALERGEWGLSKDKILRKEMEKLTDRILSRAAEVSQRCKTASENVDTKLIEVDLLINSFERISTVQFVENVSKTPSFSLSTLPRLVVLTARLPFFLKRKPNQIESRGGRRCTRDHRGGTDGVRAGGAGSRWAASGGLVREDPGELQNRLLELRGG